MSELNNWQKAVVDLVSKHFEERDNEEYLGLNDFEINKKLSINVALPDKEDKHLELVKYLANNYPCLVIYKNSDDYKQITQGIENSDSTTVSWYEIFYVIHKPDLNRPSLEYAELLQKFTGKHIVVYKGLSLRDEIKNFIFAESKGAVVLLGQ